MVCTIEKMPRSAAVRLEGGARGEQGQDNGAPDTPDTDTVPTGAALDIGRLRRYLPAHGNGKWSEISFWMIGAGVIGGLAAALFGLIDWLAIPSGTRQSGRNVARRYQRGHGDAVHRELAAPRGCSG
jgi:hypothetical protein